MVKTANKKVDLHLQNDLIGILASQDFRQPKS